MAYILQKPSAGQQVAYNVGSPIISALQNLAQMQLQNMQQQKQRASMLAGLSSFMSPENAQMFSYLPNYLQFALLSRRGGNILGNLPGKGKKLTAEQAKMFLELAGGDKKKARLLTKNVGFTL